MTAAQKELCPDIYRRLKLLCLRAGESIGDKHIWKDNLIEKRLAGGKS